MIIDSENDQAAYVDPSSGVTERVAFFDVDGSAIFTCTYLPPGSPAAGVVICPPLDAEMTRTYRKEVLLARSLAQAGFAVIRFHYRGTGNSDGDGEDISLRDMRQDAHAAASKLIADSGAESLAFVGVRWGAFVASHAAQHKGVPVVFWEPVTDASAYFRGVLRARLMQDLKAGSIPKPSTETLVEEIRTNGFVDVLGYPVRRSLFEGGGELFSESIDLPGAICLVQLDARAELKPAYAQLVEDWRRHNCEVEAIAVDEEQAWWFGFVEWQPDEDRAGAKRSIEITRDWLVKTLTSGTGV